MLFFILKIQLCFVILQAFPLLPNDFPHSPSEPPTSHESATWARWFVCIFVMAGSHRYKPLRPEQHPMPATMLHFLSDPPPRESGSFLAMHRGLWAEWFQPFLWQAIMGDLSHQLSVVELCGQSVAPCLSLGDKVETKWF